MASEDVPAWGQVLTANGDATGYVLVGDTSGYYPGAVAWLSRDNKNQRVIITEVKDATHVGVRFIPDIIVDSTQLYYGTKSDTTGFTTVLNSRLDMPAQIVRVISPQFSKISKA